MQNDSSSSFITFLSPLQTTACLSANWRGERFPLWCYLKYLSNISSVCPFLSRSAAAADDDDDDDDVVIRRSS